MKFSVTLLWISLVAISAAAPKFAVVRVTDIYRELPSTAEMQKDLKSQRDAILQNKRAVQLRGIIGELQVLQSQIQAKKNEIESESGKKLVRDFEIKRQEAETLRQEFEEFRESEDKRINKVMVETMRSSLDRISGAAQQIAKERNLEGVFDVSGNSNTGLPFVLYIADSEDLTEGVIELLAEKPLDEAEETPETAEEAETPAETGDKPEE
ncbi:MAG: OmpH family outer membrane protein [Luteolibacter sp.]